jgi:transposase
VFAGIDSHKETLAVAVTDDCGRAVIVRELPNEARGFTALAALAAEHGVQRVGIEGRPTSAGPRPCTWSRAA